MAKDIAYRGLLAAMWLAWCIYWWALSRNVKTSIRLESPTSRLLHIAPMVLAAFLMWTPRFEVAPLDRRFLPRAEWTFWVGAALTAAGLLFTVWARVHLGRNWSAIVTIKEGHELVTSGPYRFVRHPIYTGLLLGFAGSAIAVGEWRGVLGMAIVFWSLWRKLGVEERWMREQFAGRYEAYATRVRALVPFVF